jgi:acyl-CoA thioesterase II
MNDESAMSSTDSSVVRMLDIFDVEQVGACRFVGTSDGGRRRVVDGSQLLGQAIVAASKTFPRHTARSAHAVFLRAIEDESEAWFEVDVLHRGRTFASAVVTVGQHDRRCITITVLLDVNQPDVIVHAAAPPDVGDPDDAIPFAMSMTGRQLRLVGIQNPDDPDEVGPPTLDAWLHYQPIPARPDLAKALIAHFTGHLSISTTMRAHEGIGTSMAHHDLSTAVMAISITFHDPVTWTGWLLYHHESTQVAGGMSYVRGQVFTEEGQLIASFSQDGMIRALAGDQIALSKSAAERL